MMTREVVGDLVQDEDVGHGFGSVATPDFLDLSRRRGPADFFLRSLRETEVASITRGI